VEKTQRIERTKKTQLQDTCRVFAVF